MPNLAVQYPAQVGGSDLYNALDFSGWDQRNQQFRQAMQNEMANRQAAELEQMFAAQFNPLKIAGAKLDNEGKVATNRMHAAEAGLKENQLSRDSQTSNAKVQEELKKIAASASDNDLKLLENTVHQLRLSKDPKQRALGDALFGQLGDVTKHRETLRSHEKVASGHDATSLAVARMNNASRESIAAKRSVSASLGDKPPKNAREAMAFWDHKAYLTDNPEEKAEFQRRAAEQELLYQKELVTKALAPTEGKVDLSRLPGSQIPVRPGVTPQATPRGNNPLAASPTPSPVSDPIRKAVIQAGGVYEPDKFEYRITPDGRVQKRAKQ